MPYALKLPAIVVERISTNRGAAIIHYKSVYIGQPCIIRLQEQFHRLVATAIAGRGFTHWQIVVVEAFHLNLTIFIRRLSKVERQTHIATDSAAVVTTNRKVCQFNWHLHRSVDVIVLGILSS